jgi:hypothetical protein
MFFIGMNAGRVDKIKRRMLLSRCSSKVSRRPLKNVANFVVTTSTNSKKVAFPFRGDIDWSSSDFTWKISHFSYIGLNLDEIEQILSLIASNKVEPFA